MQFENLVIIGTSHIARASVQDIDEAMARFVPGVVALELDQHRLSALVHPQKQKISLQSIRQVGVKGFVFSVIGAWVERKLGDKVGMKPGAEMLHAYHCAQKAHARVAVIDQDIAITLRRFSEVLSWMEKLRFFGDLFFSFFSRKKRIAFDLTKVPSQKLVHQLVSEVRERYPNVYRVLVEERNEVMADHLIQLMCKFPDKIILAVIGAGHEKEVLQLVKRRFKNVKRLSVEKEV